MLFTNLMLLYELCVTGGDVMNQSSMLLLAFVLVMSEKYFAQK